jgi:hypothetical protein
MKNAGNTEKYTGEELWIHAHPHCCAIAQWGLPLAHERDNVSLPIAGVLVADESTLAVQLSTSLYKKFCRAPEFWLRYMTGLARRRSEAVRWGKVAIDQLDSISRNRLDFSTYCIMC